MKKTRYVISRKSQPTGLMLTLYGFIAFLLYYFKVDNLWWGVYGVLVFLLIIGGLHLKWREEELDLFDEKGKIRKELLP